MNDSQYITGLDAQKGESTKTVEETEKYYTMMIRRMNHEFGNAITLINSSLQIIESSHPEVTGFKYWNSAMEDVQHIVRLINGISTYNNGSSIKCEYFDISKMIQNIAKSFSINSLCSNIDISADMSSDIPDVYGDPLKLRQTFINLIKNAAEAIIESDKYTDNIHGAISISVIPCPSASHVKVSVSDTGCGITEEQLKNIFCPLVSFKKCGTGLGLPIIKKIIEAHGGAISVHSIPGEGSTFTVTLPCFPTQKETSDREV